MSRVTDPTAPVAQLVLLRSEGSHALTNISLPRPRLDLDAIRARYRAVASSRPTDFRSALVASVVDVPRLVSEVEELWSQLVFTRRRYADLLAAARATLAADRDGEADPLFYLRDEVSAQDGGPA